MISEQACNEHSGASDGYVAGNMQGRYFTQWRVDLLAELLGHIRERGVTAADAAIWYDEPSDFHYLSFMARGKVFAVRFYKVFSMSINGVDNWTGVVRSDVIRLANHIADVAT